MQLFVHCESKNLILFLFLTNSSNMAPIIILASMWPMMITHKCGIEFSTLPEFC